MRISSTFFLLAFAFSSQTFAALAALDIGRSGFNQQDCFEEGLQKQLTVKPNVTNADAIWVQVFDGALQDCASTPSSAKQFSAASNTLLISDLIGDICKSESKRKQKFTIQICVGNAGAAVSQGRFPYDPSGAGGGTVAEAKDFTVTDEENQIIIEIKGNEARFNVCYALHKTSKLKDETEECVKEGGILSTDSGPRIVFEVGEEDRIILGETYDFKIRKDGDKAFTKIKTGRAFAAYSALQVWDVAPNPWSFGCSAVPSSKSVPFVWFSLLALGLWLIRVALSKRRSRLAGLGIVCVLSLGSGPANAYLGQASAAIVGSPYLPNLDGSTTAYGTRVKPIYSCMFYGSTLPFLGLEGEVHLWDDFGSLRAGLGAQYTFASGNALYSSELTPCTTISSIRTNLHLLHLKPMVSYVFDRFVDIVPIVPYARLSVVGAGYYFIYRSGPDTRGESTEQTQSLHPLGIRLGYEIALGMMFSLNWLEPELAARSEGEEIYKHMYLKADVAYMSINQFGQRGINLSPRTFQMPLMFTFGLGVDLP